MLDERLARGFAILQAEPDEGRPALEPKPLCIGKVWPMYREKKVPVIRQPRPKVTPEAAALIAHILMAEDERRKRVMAMVRGLTQGFTYVGMVDGMPRFINRKLEE